MRHRVHSSYGFGELNFKNIYLNTSIEKIVCMNLIYNHNNVIREDVVSYYYFFNILPKKTYRILDKFTAAVQ